jgi:hypothetical protein
MNLKIDRVTQESIVRIIRDEGNASVISAIDPAAKKFMRYLKALQACEAKATVINFDDVAEGTSIEAAYSSKGVTFANLGGASLSKGVYARNMWGVSSSDPNCISVFQSGMPCFDAYYGVIEARFAIPQAVVSIDAKPVLFVEPLSQTVDAIPYLEAYDAAGSLIGRTFYPAEWQDSQWGNWQKLEIASTLPNITSIRFSSIRLYPYVYAFFDTLRFSPCNPALIKL